MTTFFSRKALSRFPPVSVAVLALFLLPSLLPETFRALSIFADLVKSMVHGAEQVSIVVQGGGIASIVFVAWLVLLALSCVIVRRVRRGKDVSGGGGLRVKQRQAGDLSRCGKSAAASAHRSSGSGGRRKARSSSRSKKQRQRAGSDSTPLRSTTNRQKFSTTSSVQAPQDNPPTAEPSSKRSADASPTQSTSSDNVSCSPSWPDDSQLPEPHITSSPLTSSPQGHLSTPIAVAAHCVLPTPPITSAPTSKPSMPAPEVAPAKPRRRRNRSRSRRRAATAPELTDTPSVKAAPRSPQPHEPAIAATDTAVVVSPEPVPSAPAASQVEKTRTPSKLAKQGKQGLSSGCHMPAGGSASKGSKKFSKKAQRPVTKTSPRRPPRSMAAKSSASRNHKSRTHVRVQPPQQTPASGPVEVERVSPDSSARPEPALPEKPRSFAPGWLPGVVASEPLLPMWIPNHSPQPLSAIAASEAAPELSAAAPEFVPTSIAPMDRSPLFPGHRGTSAGTAPVALFRARSTDKDDAEFDRDTAAIAASMSNSLLDDDF